MRLVLFFIIVLISMSAFAQPKNDSCYKPQGITISKGGFGVGVYSTDTFNIRSARIEASEYFHPDLVSVGNDKKSIWFKFYLPVKRAVKIELKQPKNNINSKDVGFVTYKSNSCFPGYTEATNAYITPLNQFGSSFHPCMEAGWYMIQIGSKSSANGPVFLELTISYPVQYSSVNSSNYDLTDSAYQFGTLSTGRNAKNIEYQTGCHTLQDSSEYYPSIGSDYKNYSQTSWHIFKTGQRIDYLELLLAEAVTNPMQYFPAGTKIFANVYIGNVRTKDYRTLKKLDSCLLFDFDNRISSKGFAGKSYLCNLSKNSYYSIQLIFKTDFYKDIRLTLRQRTADSSALSPQPIRAKMANTSKLGTLKSSPSGYTNVIRDYLSCESRLLNSACGNVNPSKGITLGGINYGLATWVSFKLSTAANLKFEFLNSNNNQCAGNLAFRLFKDSIPSNCAAMDTSKIYSRGILDGKFLYCVMPGYYSLQILGIDTADYQCGNGEHLGYNIEIGIKSINSVQYSKYGLSDSSSIDSINGLQALINNQTYKSKIDEFGCEHSVLPGANRCDTAHKKAIYRLLKIGDADNDNIPDSGLLSVFNVKTNQGPERIQYALYNKNLLQLAKTQNKYLYPDTIANPGLLAKCTNYNVAYNGSSSRYYCITPGYYTFGAFGGVRHLGIKDQTSFVFTKTATKYGNKSKPELMDTIRVNTDSKIDFFSCLNNAEVIDGAVPCGNKKVIYREFYLASPQLIQITNFNPTSFAFIGSISLYRGRISQGKAGLRLVKDPDGRKWECFTGQRSNDCYPMPAGWYTVVSSAAGPGYDDKVPFDDVASQNSGNVNGKNRISINILAQVASKFNRPHKAWPVDDSLNAGKPLSWKPNFGTKVNPKNGYIFNLRTENFTCIPDTPFSMHPIAPCNNNNNHLAYYVFSLQYESYLRVTGLNANIKVFIYDFDVRKDSSKMTKATPVQGCNTYSRIEMCRIKAGTYTMVLMCSNGATFPLKVTPSLYIDSVGTSRFDFAKQAYDFGSVNGDSIWYSGKKGTSHPTVSGRPASSDFFFCTTGSSTTDPVFACGGYYNPNIYPDKKNNPQYNIDSMGNKYTYLGYHAVRNLWYTFTLKGAGRAKIKIDNLTNGTTWGNNLSYGVYLSDERGVLNFDTLRKYGRVDSTASSGLSQIGYQPSSGQCNGTDWLSVSKDICDSLAERRYYIVVSLNEATLPNLNSQIAVSILYDSVPIPPKRFDHYSQANVVNGLNQNSAPYTNVILKSNVLLQGVQGFFAASTTDTSDQTKACTVYGKKSGTIWYKFKIDSTGTLNFNLRRYTFASGYHSFIDYTPANNKYDENIVLLKEFVSGDSTSNGLRKAMFDYNPVTLSKYGRDFATTCISKGWYYIQLSNCGFECSDILVPEMVIHYQKGDFCQTPVAIKLNSLGTTSANAVVNCHSIGEGFGEDGSNMGCLYGPKGYKSTWFKIDYNDSTKADIEFKLTENTNYNPSNIRFRTFYGGCAALSPGPCNTNSQTIFSLTCMKKGSYFVQVVTPSDAIGSLDLQITAKKNLDTTCKPVDTWTPNANYTFNRYCPLNKIYFKNFSTKGDSVKYKWNFGFGKIDSSFSPTVSFPVSTSDVVYKVKLIVYNPSRKASDSITQNITIPSTPIVKLRADTAICKGDTIKFTFSHPKYRHFWQNKSTLNALKVTSQGWISLTVIQKFGNDSCILNDSAFVKLNQNPVFNLGNDTALCKGDSLTLIGPPKMKSYLWSNGKKIRSINISGQTTQLIVTDSNNCVAKDLIQTTNRVYVDTIIRPVKPVCVNITSLAIKAKPTYSGSFYGNSNITGGGIFNPKTAGAGNHKVYYKFNDVFGCLFKDSVIIKVNPLPDARINTAGPVCIDASVITLYPTTNKGGKFYGGNYVDNAGKFNPTKASVGKNKVYYTFKDANLCENIDSISILVNQLPDAAILEAGPYCFDAGIQVMKPKTNSGGKFFGGNFIDSTGKFNPKMAKSGISRIYYIFKDANKCVSKDSTQILVNSLPDASVNKAGPFCIDAGNQEVTPKYNKGGNFSGGTFIDVAGNFNPQKATAGLHKIYYLFKDSNSCTNKDSITIRVNSLPDASIISSGPFCIDGGFKTIKPKTNAGGKFFGGSFIDSAGKFNPRDAMSGLHKVYYIFKDSNSCINNDSTQIKVNDLPDAGIKLAGPFCIDAGVQIINPKTNKGGKFYGGNYVDSAGKFEPKTAGSGLKSIHYTFTDSNKCTNVDSIKILVNSLPDASIQSSGPFCIDAGIQPVKPKSKIKGKFSGGNYIDTSGVFNPKTAGIGLSKVIYKSIDSNACANKDSIFIRVNPLPDTRINPAGPFCINAGVQVILPKTNTGGKFYGGKYIDSAGNYNPATSKVGVYKVVYSLTDINLCKNKDSILVRVNPLPDASIMAAGPFCLDAAIQSIKPKKSSGGNFFGGLYIDSTGKFNPKIAGVETHKIYYRFRDINSCTGLDSIFIIINPLPNAEINLAGPYCLDAGIKNIFPKINLGGIFSGGSYIEGNGKFDPKKSGFGKHKVYYQFVDVNTCKSKDSIVVVVNALPDARISAGGPFCINSGIVKINPLVNTGGKFYGGSYIDSLGNFNNKLAKTGRHKVVYKITDGYGCRNRDSIDIIVNGLPDTRINPAGPFCDNDGVKVITAVVPSPGGSFFGKFIDNSGNFIPSQASVGISLNEVYYKAMDVNNCKDTTSIHIKVNTKPVFDFEAKTREGCVPLLINFEGALGYKKYEWNFGNSKKGIGQQAKSIYPVDEKYDVSLAVVDSNNCSSTITKQNYITSYPRPKADFNYAPFEINLGITHVQFTNFSTGKSIREYKWSVEDVFESDQENFSKIFYDSGYLKINLLAINEWGCRDSAAQYIFVIDTFMFFVPNAFSPNNDGINDIFKVGGIGIQYLEMTIYNRWGEILFNRYDESNSFGWDGIYLGEVVPQGSYMFTIKTKDSRNRPYYFKGIVTVLR